MTVLENRAILNIKIVIYSNVYWNRLFKDYMRDCYVFLHISHTFFILTIAGRNQMKFWFSSRFFYWSKGEGAFDINK